MEEKYYIIIFANTDRPEIYRYTYKTIFTLKSAMIFKERWEKKNSPYKAVIVEEINERDKKINEVLNAKEEAK